MKKLLSLLLALALCAGLGVPAPAAAGFSDVAADSPFAPAISWAVEKGVTKGTTPTTFGPGNTCTTSHILTFLWRAAGRPGDAGEERAAVSAWASGLGIDVSDLSAPCTRAAAVTDIWKAQGSPAASEAASFTDVAPSAPYAGAVSWAVEAGVTNGTGGGAFSPEAVCTRGQIVTFLYRALGGSKAAEKPEAPTGSGTLANGKPITEENVTELLNELRTKYPDGTLYASVGTKISTNIYRSVYGDGTGTQCAGWAALANDYIFGITAPVRFHKNFNQARIGDVFSSKEHTMVITGINRCILCGNTAYTVCDSNRTYLVSWKDGGDFCLTCDLPIYTDTCIITRYPADSTVPYLQVGTRWTGDTGSTGSSESTDSTSSGAGSGSSDSTDEGSFGWTWEDVQKNMVCDFCGKPFTNGRFSGDRTKRVCSDCYSRDEVAANAYLNS